MSVVLQWIRTPVGIVVGILSAALLVFGGVKLYGVYDEYRNLKHDKQTKSAAARKDSANTERDSSALYADRDSIIRVPYIVYRQSPQVKKNPTADTLGQKCDSLVGNLDSELRHKKSEAELLRRALHDLETRPEKKGPRAIPYVEPLYSFSNSGGRPLIRAGVDYRLLGAVRAKVEASYEPPPAGENTPSFRLNVGGRINFR